MPDAQLVIGDDQILAVDLVNADGTSPGDISAASSVQVALTTADRKTVVIGPLTASSSTFGANWVGTEAVPPRVAVSITGSLTTGLTMRDLAVEVQVILAGTKTTYFGRQRVALVRGLIP